MTSFSRDGKSPRELLEKFIQTDPEFARAAKELQPPVAKPLGELVRHADGNDPNELIKHRFLCRGASALFVGSTGIGKSSLTLQMSVMFACGLTCFGLVPARPMKILIVQAENDEGDLAEMRDGVIGGLNLTPEQRATACANILTVTEDAKTREGFAAMLDAQLLARPCDIVVADPAFAYIGGDASSQRDVSPFLRNMINPVIHKHNIGFILVHHVNKPPQGEQKAKWQAGDFAYLGSGSSEFANWARAVIALRSIGSDSIFELRLAKRGRRARWRDEHDRPTNARYIAYDREPGVICWREATAAEVEAEMGSDKPTIQDVVDIIGDEEIWQADLSKQVQKETGLKKTAAYDLVKDAVKAGVLRVIRSGERGAKLLRRTDKLQPRRMVSDAGDEP